LAFILGLILCGHTARASEYVLTIEDQVEMGNAACLPNGQLFSDHPDQCSAAENQCLSDFEDCLVKYNRKGESEDQYPAHSLILLAETIQVCQKHAATFYNEVILPACSVDSNNKPNLQDFRPLIPIVIKEKGDPTLNIPHFIPPSVVGGNPPVPGDPQVPNTQNTDQGGGDQPAGKTPNITVAGSAVNGTPIQGSASEFSGSGCSLNSLASGNFGMEEFGAMALFAIPLLRALFKRK